MHHLLLITALCFCTTSAFGAVQFTIVVVDDATWQADVADGWVAKYLANRNSMTWDIIVPPHADAIPVLGLDGTYDADAWGKFTAGKLNPVKNAVRLLGPPATVERLADNTIRLAWKGVRIRGARAADDASVELIADEKARTFTWKRSPVPTTDKSM